MALTSVPLARVHMGIAAADTSIDAWLNQVIPQVDLAIRNELGREVIEYRAGIVEYLDGNGLQNLYLRHTPVQSITEVRLDHAGYAGQGAGFGSTTVLTAGTDYYLRKDDVNGWSRAGTLVRINAVWPRRNVRTQGQLTGGWVPGQGNVMVTYVAGYTSSANAAPADLTLAANQVIAQLRSRRTTGMPLQSESLGEYSYSLAAVQQALMTGDVPAILARYRKGTALIA